MIAHLPSGQMDWTEDFPESEIKDLLLVAIAAFIVIMRFGPEALQP